MKKSIQRALEVLLKVKVIAEWRLNKYGLACQLQELFNYLNIDTVLDVGANEGQYATFLRQEVGFKGTILSFEPAQGPYTILEEKSGSDSNWHCFFMALGAEEKVEKFNVMAESQFNSLRMPDTKTLFQDKNVVVDSYDMDIRTLNTLWEELQKKYGLSSPYLKLDTQGFDLEVLKGSENILYDIKALQSEMSIIPIYKDIPSHKEVTLYLENKNFSLSGMYPVNLDSQMKLIEYDGIFINEVHTNN